MRILAIETSCDETAASVVEDGQKALSNVIASQIAQHARTGGVVPEAAAREHMKVMIPTLRQAMKEAACEWKNIDAIAVTKEPGLIGSLLVGRMTAAALAFAKNKPLIEVNHVHGHIYSSWLDLDEDPEFPILVLTVSGGHNELVLLEGHGQMKRLGETLDDSAGEAFDKVARLLQLGYPGGPVIEKRASLGNARAVRFPRALLQGYDFSFSGLKTSVFYYLKKNEKKRNDESFVNDVAASFQEAVVDALARKLMKAVQAHLVKEVHLTGGVSANKALRARIEKDLAQWKNSSLKNPPRFRTPQKMSYCTDNAAMIGAAAYYSLGKSRFLKREKAC